MDENEFHALAQLVPFPPVAVLSTYQLAHRALFTEPKSATPSAAAKSPLRTARSGSAGKQPAFRFVLGVMASRAKGEINTRCFITFYITVRARPVLPFAPKLFAIGKLQRTERVIHY